MESVALHRASPVVPSLLLAGLSLAALPASRPVAFVLALTLATLAVLDWKVPHALLVGAYAAVLVLVPGHYRLAVAGPINLTPERLALLVLLPLWLLGFLRESESTSPPRTGRIATPLLGLLVWAGISVVANSRALSAAGTLMTAMKRSSTLVGFFVCFALTVALVRSRREAERFLAVLTNIGAFAAVVGVVERLSGTNVLEKVMAFLPFEASLASEAILRGSGDRVYGTATHPIEFGGLMSLLLPVAAYLALTRRSRAQRAWYTAVTGLLGMSLLFSVSRSSLLAAGAMVVLLLAASPAAERKKISIAALLGLFGVHMAFPGLLGTYRWMLTPSNLYEMEVLSYSGRLNDYPLVWQMFTQRPLFGLGYGGFDPTKLFHLDNQYLGMVVTLGLPGLLLTLWFLGRLIRATWKAARLRVSRGEGMPLESALCASFGGFAVLCALFDTFAFFQVSSLFMVLAGCAAVALSESGAEPAEARVRRFVVGLEGAR